MLRDYLIEKPRGLDTYGLHKFVEALTEGHDRPLFSDLGGDIMVRTTADLGDNGTPLVEVTEGALYLFHLTATVANKQGGRLRYYPSAQRAVREEWLQREAERHGFDLVAVHITADKDVIRKKDTDFAIDKTEFTGVLRALDTEKVMAAQQTGIGRVGKAFGSGLLQLKPL